MALQKDKTSEQGVAANYWRIDMLEMSKSKKRVRCVLGLYSSAATASDKKPLEEKRYVWKGEEAETMIEDNDVANKDNIVKAAYKKIKAQDPELNGATDV